MSLFSRKPVETAREVTDDANRALTDYKSRNPDQQPFNAVRTPEHDRLNRAAWDAELALSVAWRDEQRAQENERTAAEAARASAEEDRHTRRIGFRN